MEAFHWFAYGTALHHCKMQPGKGNTLNKSKKPRAGICIPDECA